MTLRLWLDPEGPDSERACCSPDAVIAARETCHALGLPHVTLDLREEFRRAIVTPFVRGYARGETPNPCIRCNGSFRFAELLAFARRAGARGSRPATTRASSSTAAGCSSRAPPTRRRISRTCSPASTRGTSTASGSRSASRTRTRRARRRERAGLAAAHRAESQEACFLAGDDYRAFLGRHGLEPRAGAIVDEDGASSARTTASGASRPGSARASASRRREPLYVLDADAATNTVVVGPRESLARTRVRAPRAALRRRPAAPRRSSATARPRSAAASTPTGAVHARARRAGVRRRARTGRRSLRRRRRRRCGTDHVRRCDRIGVEMLVADFTGEISGGSPRRLPVRCRPRARHTLFVRLGGTFERLSSLITGSGARGLARDQQGRRHRWTA